MTTYISFGDILDIQRKFSRRGLQILKGLLKHGDGRAGHFWDQTELGQGNWWNIPTIRQRWNEKITGSPNQEYPEWFREKYLKGKAGLRLASPGCGTGSHELKLASFPEIKEILAFDLSPVSIEIARKQAPEKVRYEVLNFYVWLEEKDTFDLILFHSSLHHLHDLDLVIPRLREKLNPGGMLLVHEYTGPTRMMWSREQLAEVNRLLKTLPAKYRRIAGSNSRKNKHYRPGLWRTLLTDPSESIESGKIRSLLHEHFHVLTEKEMGGNILHLLLKDIAHHFTAENDPEAREILKQLFEAEDTFLKKYPSDFIFGVYTHRNPELK